MTFTSKNAKAKPTESANSAKKTNADDIAKKATLKTAGPTKNRTTFTAANIPAFFPEYPDYRLSDIVSTIEYRKDPWAANKRFKILKFKFKFPMARTFELFRARSRLYRSQILQVNTRWN